jgi:hypothetical protein
MGGAGAFLALGVALFVIILTAGRETPGPPAPGKAVVQGGGAKDRRPATGNEDAPPPSKEVIDKTKATTGPKPDLPPPKPEEPLPKKTAEEVKKPEEAKKQEAKEEVKKPAPDPRPKTEEVLGTGFILPIEIVDNASGRVQKKNALHVLGTPERLSKIGMISLTVVSTTKDPLRGNKLTATNKYFWAKGKARTDADIPGWARYSAVVNRDRASMIAEGVKFALDKETAAESRRWICLVCATIALLPLEEWTSKATALGDSEVRGKKVYGLQIASAGEEYCRVYFDKTTGLLTKVEWRGRTTSVGTGERSEKRIVSELYALDHRKVDGIWQPARFEEWHDGKLGWNHVVTRIQLSERVDERQFAVP